MTNYRKVTPRLRRLVYAAYLRDRRLSAVPGFNRQRSASERIARLTGLSQTTIHRLIRPRFGLTRNKDGSEHKTKAWRRLYNRKLYDLDLEPRVMHPLMNERPKTRGDCKDGPRPCPWVGCRYHLWLNVTDTSMYFRANSSVDALMAMQQTCALDVADEDGAQIGRLAELLAVDKETIRLYINSAMNSVRRNVEAARTDLDRRVDEDDGERLAHKKW